MVEVELGLNRRSRQSLWGFDGLGCGEGCKDFGYGGLIREENMWRGGVLDLVVG